MLMVTVLEIAGNPKDLAFSVHQVANAGLRSPWGTRITRSKGHNFKPLLATTEPHQLVSSREEALNGIERLLYLAVIAAADPTQEATRPLASITDPQQASQLLRSLAEELGPVNQHCLSIGHIDRIMQTLRDNNHCDTSALL